jgi:replicative DNA helicase
MLKKIIEIAESGTQVNIFAPSKERIVDELVSTLSGVPYINIETGNLTDKQFKSYCKAGEKLAELPIYIAKKKNALKKLIDEKDSVVVMEIV